MRLNETYGKKKKKTKDEVNICKNTLRKKKYLKFVIGEK